MSCDSKKDVWYLVKNRIYIYRDIYILIVYDYIMNILEWLIITCTVNGINIILGISVLSSIARFFRLFGSPDSSHVDLIGQFMKKDHARWCPIVS